MCGMLLHKLLLALLLKAITRALFKCHKKMHSIITLRYTIHFYIQRNKNLISIIQTILVLYFLFNRSTALIDF